MLRKLMLAAAAGSALMVPSTAHASFYPGEYPEDTWTCGAGIVRLSVLGECAQPQQRTAATQTQLHGGAVVTSKDVTVGYTGETGDAAGGVATVAAGEVRVTGVGINVQAFGMRVTQSGHCGASQYNDVFDGSVHIDRLVVNGRTYTNLDSHREIPLGLGKVVVGGVDIDHYENSFDPGTGRTRIAVQVIHGTTRVSVGEARVHVDGFCHA